MRSACAPESTGAAIAMARAIFEEWRLTHSMDEFKSWLEQGAPSDDANEGSSSPSKKPTTRIRKRTSLIAKNRTSRPARENIERLYPRRGCDLRRPRSVAGGSALFLLLAAAWTLVEGLSFSGLAKDLTVEVVDQILLVLMIIEILSTVQVSFREHVLTPEPFLVVGLIAAIRRILIITAEFSNPSEILEAAFRNAMFELGLLTVLIFSLVFSLHFLKKNRAATVERE